MPFALVNLLPLPSLTEAPMLTAVNLARLLRGATPSAACNPAALLPPSCWQPHRSILLAHALAPFYRLLAAAVLAE